MTPLYTQQEFDSCKSRGLLPLECCCCKTIFYKEKHYLQAAEYKYCSRKCQGKGMTTSVNKPCGSCGNPVNRVLNEYKSSKTGQIFCNSSCSAKYSNTHKKHGTRVSKLEVWLSQKLIELYPQYEFHFNKIDTVNAELDIYIFQQSS